MEKRRGTTEKVQLPPGFPHGPLVGRQGIIAKQLSAMPGITRYSLEREAGLVTVTGSSAEAVATCIARIRDIILRHELEAKLKLDQGYRPAFSYQLLDLTASHVRFLPAHNLPQALIHWAGTASEQSGGMHQQPHKLMLVYEPAATTASCTSPSIPAIPPEHMHPPSAIFCATEMESALYALKTSLLQIAAAPSDPSTSQRFKIVVRFGKNFVTKLPEAAAAAAGLSSREGHLTVPASGVLLPSSQMRSCRVPQDLNFQWVGGVASGSLAATQKRLQEVLQGPSCGYELLTRSSSTVVHVMHGASSRSYSCSVRPEDTPEARAQCVDALARIRAACSFYEVLGVPKAASAADIKRAYRKEVLVVHPDKNPLPGAESGFKLLSKAYDELSDPSRRRFHDCMLPATRALWEEMELGTATQQERLQVTKCYTQRVRHGFVCVLRPQALLEYRLMVEGKRSHREDAQLMAFLNQAWEDRQDGVMQFPPGSHGFLPDVTRYKQRLRFTRGDLKLNLSHVTSVPRAGIWEIAMGSWQLRELFKSSGRLRVDDMDAAMTGVAAVMGEAQRLVELLALPPGQVQLWGVGGTQL